MRVFFYGLFMDERLLAAKGIKPVTVHSGFVNGFTLRIGERATLLVEAGGRAYGVMMEMTSNEAAALYTEESVADYKPETVTVELMDGTKMQATCYNLPADKVTGTNKGYAQSLLDVAQRLEFPASYLDQIRQAGGN